MRVLLLNYEFPPAGGGAGYATANIARSLVKMGIQAEVLTSRIGGEEDGELVGGVPVHRVWSWRLNVHDCGLRGAYTYVLAAALKRRQLHAQRRYDLEHYFFSMPTGLLTLIPGAGPATPYIVSLRGSDVPGYDPRNTKIQRIHTLLKPITRRIWSRSRKVIALSNALAETAMKTAPELEISVIPNGIDTEQFSPLARGEPRSDIRLLTVARLIERKGIRTILEACAKPTVLPITLQIIGTGPYEGALRRMVDSLGLGGRVRFLGHVANAKLPEYYRASDIFVLSSTAESFGLVFAEAMSSGLPIAASDVGGIPETVRNGIDGLLCPPDDPAQLRHNILRLMSSAKTRHEIGKSQRQRILQHYRWEQIAARYAAVYRSVLEVPDAGPVPCRKHH